MAAIDDIAALLKSTGLDPRQANGVLEAFRIALTGGISLTVKESGTTVSSSVTALDFGAGFDVTESPAGEANVALDMAEAPYDNATSGLAATDVQAAIDELAASGGGGGVVVQSQFDDGFTYTAPDFLSADGTTLANNSGSASQYAAGVSHVCSWGADALYAEIHFAGTPNWRDAAGIILNDSAERTSGIMRDYYVVTAHHISFTSGGVSYAAVGGSGNASFGAAWGTTQIVQIAWHRATGKIYFGLAGTWQGGFDPVANDATGVFSNTTWEHRARIYVSCYNNGVSAVLKTRASDFAYSPPTGYEPWSDEP